jgi:hypothetical protein
MQKRLGKAFIASPFSKFNLYELNGEVENRHWHGV